MSGDKCLKIHIGVKCHLASNVTCLLVVKCLWRQLSQPLTGVRGPASKVWATNVLGVKQLESYEMTHYTNLHTFTVNTKNLCRKMQHFGTILCFRRFSEHNTKVKLGLNYAKLFKMFLTLSTILNEILEPIGE